MRVETIDQLPCSRRPAKLPFPYGFSFRFTLLMVKVVLLGFVLFSSVQAQKLEKSALLALQWSSNEIFTSAFLKKDELVVFSTVVDLKRKQSTLNAYGLDAGSGSLRWKRSLDSVRVGNWQPTSGKGTVAQTFANAVASGLRGDLAVPLLYQYRVACSPDGSKVLTYFYDYSQASLSARTILFDNAWKPLHSDVVPIDKQVTNQGLFVNDQGELLILNSREGDVQLLQYDFDNGNRYLLEIPGSTAPGGQFRLQLAGDEAWVLSSSIQGSVVSGAVLSRFDLKHHTTVQVQYLPLSQSLQKALGSSSHYEFAGCWISPRKEVSLVLENKNILSSGFVYRPAAVHDWATWQPRKAMVQLESAVVATYDTLGVSLDERIIQRNEKKSAADVCYPISFVVHPQPGLPEWLASDRPFVRLERTKGSFQLNTYSRRVEE